MVFFLEILIKPIITIIKFKITLKINLIYNYKNLILMKKKIEK
jgi:hypothetical protein